jgi:murein L,D-transpeptidase YcbB/YkuD
MVQVGKFPGLAILLSLSALMLGGGCEAKEHAPAKQSVTGASTGAVQLSAEGQAALRQIVDSGRDADLHWPDFSPYQADVKAFYDSSNYALAWVRNRQPSATALQYIPMFQQAAEKGLVPEDYDGSLWGDRVSRLKASPADADLAKFDAALTVSLMRYVRALNVGRVNPKMPGRQVNLNGQKLDPAVFLHETLENAADSEAAMKAVEPPWPGYWRTLDWLHRATAIVKQDSGELLPVPQKLVLPGQAYASVPRLAALLRLIGDLPGDAQVDQNSGVYGGAMVEAVKQYQDRHGLDVDGKLSASVVNDLNVPLSHRLEQIVLTLERWRWVEHSFPQPPIVVNVPEFKLRAYDATGHVVLFKKVIVGKAYGHHTPLFEKDIKYVVFRPYWEVTPSIQRGETVPHLERDRNYVAKNNFEVVSADGKVVTDGVVSDDVLAQLRAGRYHVRQKPGPSNSLGLVKIIFPNPDNVYLHGTDAPQLFTASRRDFSHGCVRVENPADLVAWVLRYNPGWDLQRVQAAMNGKTDNVTVNLAKPIPALILYATVATLENGRAYFLDDIYGFDAQLKAVLAKGYPYPSA